MKKLNCSSLFLLIIMLQGCSLVEYLIYPDQVLSEPYNPIEIVNNEILAAKQNREPSQCKGFFVFLSDNIRKNQKDLDSLELAIKTHDTSLLKSLAEEYKYNSDLQSVSTLHLINYAIFIEQGNIEEASVECEAAVDVSPDYWRAYMHLSYLQYMKGENEKSRESLLKGFELHERPFMINFDYDSVRQCAYRKKMQKD